MKAYYTNNLNWTFIIEIVITIHGIHGAQGAVGQNLIASCNEKKILNCEWFDNARQQNGLDELIVKLNDDGDTNLMKYQNQNNFSPRFATLYDQNSALQLPLVRTRKDQLKQPAWNEVNKNRKFQSRILFNYNKRGMNTFSSWAGKRSRVVRGDALNKKREPVFSSWGGKRTQKFFNWGGKRNFVGTNARHLLTDETLEHNIMKRNTNALQRTGSEEKHDACMTNEINLEELFKEFIDWSRKQPEQKKGSIHTKLPFGINVLRSPENFSRRTDSFFQWGGKRNTKDNIKN